MSPGTSNDFPPSESNMGIPNDTRGPTDVYIRECGDTARARLKYRFYLLSAQGRIYTQLRSMLSAQGRIYTSDHVYILICLGCSIKYFKLTFGRLWRFTMQWRHSIAQCDESDNILASGTCGILFGHDGEYVGSKKKPFNAGSLRAIICRSWFWRGGRKWVD